MAKVLAADFGRDQTIEDVIADVMAMARLRSGMTSCGFARAINDDSPYNPGLSAISIEMFEAGKAMPGADVLCRAMWLAGHDVSAALAAWVDGTTARSFPRRSSASGATKRASDPR